MILEAFFSGMGSTLIRELISLAKKPDDKRLKQLIHDALEEYARTNPSGPPIVINNVNTTVVVHQIYFLSIADELKLVREVPLALLLNGYFNLKQKATGQYLDGNGSEVYPLDANGGVYQDWKAIGVSPIRNSLNYFSPEAQYSSSGNTGAQVAEFKAMVKALHRADIEVILDVVYNHTAEGNHLGPTLSFRGIDNPTYYRLVPDNPRYYMDYTGTGNT